MNNRTEELFELSSSRYPYQIRSNALYLLVQFETMPNLLYFDILMDAVSSHRLELFYPSLILLHQMTQQPISKKQRDIVSNVITKQCLRISDDDPIRIPLVTMCLEIVKRCLPNDT